MQYIKYIIEYQQIAEEANKNMNHIGKFITTDRLREAPPKCLKHLHYDRVHPLFFEHL